MSIHLVVHCVFIRPFLLLILHNINKPLYSVVKEIFWYRYNYLRYRNNLSHNTCLRPTLLLEQNNNYICESVLSKACILGIIYSRQYLFQAILFIFQMVYDRWTQKNIFDSWWWIKWFDNAARVVFILKREPLQN